MLLGAAAIPLVGLWRRVQLARTKAAAEGTNEELEMKPEEIPWRRPAALAIAGCVPLLVAASIVVVPSGMGGVLVSQLRGTLPGTLARPTGQQAGRTVPRIAGTGLGLSICYGIIREHGGEIIAGNRTNGKGATFIVRIPLDTKSTGIRCAGRQLVNAIVKNPVLVIEDEATVLAFVRAALERGGYPVVGALSGVLGLEMLAAEEFAGGDFGYAYARRSQRPGRRSLDRPVPA